MTPLSVRLSRALYAYVLQTPSRLVGVSLVDGVGERRTQNLPGTGEDEYPNWKMPLCDGSGESSTGGRSAQQRPPIEPLGSGSRWRN